MPHYMKDLCLQYETTALGGDDHESASSEGKSGTQPLYRIQSDDSLSELEETESEHNGDGDDTGNDMDSPVIDAEVMPPDESIPLLWRSAYWRQLPSTCHLFDHEIRQECSEEAKCVKMCLACWVVLTGKISCYWHKEFIESTVEVRQHACKLWSCGGSI